MWEKKDNGEEITNIKWEIVEKCQEYVGSSKKCDVCLTEKLCIMKDKNSNSLNKRFKLTNKSACTWLFGKVKDG